MNPANEARLMKAVDQLSGEFSAAYPRARLKAQSPEDFFAYLAAKRYVQSLALSTFHLIETRNLAAFDELYRFQGKSVGELLQHMMNSGLEFAPAEPGGEAVYRKLYGCVRTFYLQLVPKPQAEDGK